MSRLTPIASRLTGLFKDIDWVGVIAFAVVAQLLIFAQPARADAGGHGENCENWREPAHMVIHFRHNGIPETHVRLIVFKILELPPPVKARVSRVIDEAYKWPRGDMDLGQYIVDLCGKAWIGDEEAAKPEPAEPEGRVPSPEYRVLAVKSQRLYCEAAGEVGERMVIDFETGFGPAHFTNAHQREIALHALACQRQGVPSIRRCVEQRCMDRSAWRVLPHGGDWLLGAERPMEQHT